MIFQSKYLNTVKGKILTTVSSEYFTPEPWTVANTIYNIFEIHLTTD